MPRIALRYSTCYYNSLADFLFMLRGRISLTRTLRLLTHFSNYAATSVAELKRGKELFPDKLRCRTCESKLGWRSCACRGWSGMKDRSEGGHGRSRDRPFGRSKRPQRSIRSWDARAAAATAAAAASSAANETREKKRDNIWEKEGQK